MRQNLTQYGLSSYKRPPPIIDHLRPCILGGQLQTVPMSNINLLLLNVLAISMSVKITTTVIKLLICANQSWEISISPPQKHLEIPEGLGGPSLGISTQKGEGISLLMVYFDPVP